MVNLNGIVCQLMMANANVHNSPQYGSLNQSSCRKSRKTANYLSVQHLDAVDGTDRWT